MNKINITAHTGNSGTADNTIESLQAAVKYGADTVEFDLRFNNDGVPVMTHSLPVESDAVTVEKAFEYLQNTDITVNIDVKETTDLKKVVRLGKKYGVWDRCFFTGVHKGFVPEVKKQCPGEKYYLNYILSPVLCHFPFYAKKLVNEVKKAGAVGLNSNYLTITKTVVKECHKNGLEVSGWTANSEKAMKKLIKLGVDNITSRKPAEVRELINNG